MAEPIVAVQQCRFLEIPLEIRLEVYRYLLLPLPSRYIGMKFKAVEAGAMHPDILRVNRQIYSESVILLYSTLDVFVGIEDIECLVDDKESFSWPMQPWRYNPLHGLGTEDKNGNHTYTSPFMSGRMDPHVFARFETVSVDVDFDFTLFINPRGVRSIKVDLNNIVNVDDCEHFERVLRQTTVFQDLKVILSNSPTIKHLLVAIKVAVRADWAGVNDPQLRSDPEVYQKQWASAVKAVDRKALEIFLDSEIIEPLRSLCNIENFRASLLLGWRPEEGQLEQKAREVGEGLSRDVERKYEGLHNTKCWNSV